MSKPLCPDHLRKDCVIQTVDIIKGELVTVWKCSMSGRIIKIKHESIKTIMLKHR